MDEDIHRIIKTTVGKFGTIHILVNNAGGPPVGTFAELSDELWMNGILINNVCPGYMLTKRQEEIIKKRSSDQNLSVKEYMT